MVRAAKRKTAGKPARTLTPHGSAQRAALVEAAFAIIAEAGFEGLRTRAVAARAGVNIATLHYYFATKEDLIRGVVDRIRATFREAHAPGERGGDGAADRLRAELQDHRFMVHEKPEIFRVLMSLSRRAGQDPELRKVVVELDREWHSHLASILAAGLKEGVFRKELDPQAVAAALTAFMKGCLFHSGTRPNPMDDPRMEAELLRWLAPER